jgi:hypothetical protein
MPCIQHYVALSDHSWRKCPICFESIYSAALKPILFLPATSYDSSQLGPSSPSIVEFTLIRRDLDSSVALPIISYRKWKTSIPSVDLVSALTFSKFTIATNEYTKMLLNNDIISLTQTLKEIECSGEASYESSFIEMCLDLLQVNIAFRILSLLRPKQLLLKKSTKEKGKNQMKSKYCLLLMTPILSTFIKPLMDNIYIFILLILKF